MLVSVKQVPEAFNQIITIKVGESMKAELLRRHPNGNMRAMVLRALLRGYLTGQIAVHIEEQTVEG